MKNNFFAFNKIASLTLIVSMLAVLFGPFTQVANAAALTALSNTMSTLKVSTAANHDIQFTTPTGVAASATIILTFQSDFAAHANLDFSDIDVLDDTVNVTLAGSVSGATWAAVRTSGTVITLTNGSGAVGAGSVVRIKIGTNASNQSVGVRQITNPTSTGTKTITMSGTFNDAGTISVQIITDDAVAVTSTVDQTLTFSISDVAIGFGTLSVSTGRWATADATGGNAATSLPTEAHTMTVATNGSTGYTITYNGATLTSGSNTIDVATISGDSDGTPGTAQFAIGFSKSPVSTTIASGYLRATNSDLKFVASTATTVVSETVAAATQTISASYLANISNVTPAGSYSTSIIYIATANF